MKKKILPLIVLLFLEILSCKNPTQEVKVTEPVSTQVAFKNSKELVLSAKKEINQIIPEQLKIQLQDSGYYVIDVREKSEHTKGNIPGSILIPRGLLEFKIGSDEFWENKELKMPNNDQKIVLYCKSGGRGTLATKSLQEMGYTNVINLDGGYLNWVSIYPSEAPE